VVVIMKKTMMKIWYKRVVKKREQNYVQEDWHPLRLHMTYFQVHIAMVMVCKFVKEKLKDLMVKKGVQVCFVKDLIKYFLQ
jgi:hypothetical protein